MQVNEVHKVSAKQTMSTKTQRKVLATMKRILIFIIACIWNILFLYLCGFWQQIPLNIDYFIDIFFGVLSVILLSLGNVSVIIQILCRVKFAKLQKKIFDIKFIRQCILFAVFYVGSIIYVRELVFVHGAFYVALFAFVMSVGWLGGSRVLWISEEKSYYLNESGKLYHVEAVVENDKVFELACTRKGERDRIITIEKKKEKTYYAE